MKPKNSIFFLCVFTISCISENEILPSNFGPEVVEANGYVVPKDSISEPVVIVVDENKLTKIPVGNPTVVLTNTNVHPAGVPEFVLAGKPNIYTPGVDTFSLPKVVSANGVVVMAGIPEIVIAKDAYTKDQNPQNFSSFKKLQGLRLGNISSLLQDKEGNLWFGTYGAGVSKYDGKSFTHYTDKEGLSHNIVLSVLEDKSGNLWFGTEGGGVSKYDGKSFTYFTEKEGLSNNIVGGIVEDKLGNLWFSTKGGGVSKYDGKSFTHFTEKEGLSNNVVLSMLEDKSGNLWFGTEGGGVSKYDGKSFTHFTEKEGLSNNIVGSIVEDKLGNLWFGTKGGGVSKYDGNCVDDIINGTNLYQHTQQDLKKNKKDLAKFFTHFTEKEGLSDNEVWSILEDRFGNIWFGTAAGGASKYDGKSFTHYTENEGLSNNDVRSMLEDKSGNLWLGTNGGGLSKYDGKSFTHFTDKEGLISREVRSILEDRFGNLWFATAAGASKYDGKSFTHFTEKEGLSDNTVLSMLEDKSGNLWFGTKNGGVSKYDGIYFTHFKEQDGLSNKEVWSILEDKSGNLWFGTKGGGVSKYDGNSFTNFTENEGLSNNDVWTILEDKFGNLWFGTGGGGVSKYDGNCVDDIINGTNLYQHTQHDLKKNKKDLVKSFTHFTEKEGLSNNEVWSILEDKSGNLWFGTKGGGVSKYDGKTFTWFTEKEGLSNNAILSMMEDKNGNLWFGTRFGLARLSKERLAELNDKDKYSKIQADEILFKNYTYDDGFLGIGVYGGKTIYEDKHGTIWVGANDRLTAYHPEEEFADTVAPNIQLTSIALFNENIAWVNLTSPQLAAKEGEQKNVGKDTSFVLGNGVTVEDFEFDGITKWYSLPENLSLAYNNNYLTFNFIGITQKQSKKVKYQYKLEGIDKNWSAITNRTEAPYGNLPHGTFTFKVKAMNSEGYWSEEFNYTFTIRPPWWKTWWFRTLVGAMILISLFGFYRWRTTSLRARQKQLEKTVEERTAELVQKNILVEEQKQVVEKQKELVEEKHKEITDSINYAERIQRSFLATKNLLDENLKNYFVLFLPKDVVSGDFYWATKLNNGNFALVTADSTGHGVPGAIMSILNITCLEKAVDEEKLVDPAEILNHARLNIIDRLKKDGSPEGGKDGMDASLICFDLQHKKLNYAAANNPILIVRHNEILQFAPDKMPVGKHDKQHLPFTSNHVDLQNGDVVYTLTDGMPDQFGGEKGKKFMYKKLKELLILIASDPMEIQKEKLQKAFFDWKGELEQVDDVCLIGVKI